MLGVEGPIVESAICPSDAVSYTDKPGLPPTSLRNGVRVPNPRVCFDLTSSGYLYDAMTGVARFHIILFASDMQGVVSTHLVEFAEQAFGLTGFYAHFGAGERFNVILVTKALPKVADALLNGNAALQRLRQIATLVYDDRPPDEDAHYWFAINHARGAVVVSRPDLQVGISTSLDSSRLLYEYFSSFLHRLK
jgi:phenol 2-monooxygenase